MGSEEIAAETRTVPLDVNLGSLDRDLTAAGLLARAAGRGSTQPTRYFTQQLRARALEALSSHPQP